MRKPWRNRSSRSLAQPKPNLLQNIVRLERITHCPPDSFIAEERFCIIPTNVAVAIGPIKVVLNPTIVKRLVLIVLFHDHSEVLTAEIGHMIDYLPHLRLCRFEQHERCCTRSLTTLMMTWSKLLPPRETKDLFNFRTSPARNSPNR